MASLSSIHSELINKISALFPNKTQFNADDEAIDDNPIQFLTNGWGLKTGSGSPVDQDDVPNDSLFAINRLFSIMLTREVYDLRTSMDSYNTNLGLLADDMDTLVADLLDFAKVPGMKGGEEIDHAGDGGVNTLTSGKKNFIFMEVVFSFELTQKINQ